MIVRMKKTTILVSNCDLDGSLQIMRKLGVLHIKHVRPPASDDITEIERNIENIEQALRILDLLDFPAEGYCEDSVAAKIDEVVSLYGKRQEILGKQGELARQISWYKKWGDVSLESLSELNDAGIFVKLYAADKSALKKIPGDKVVQILDKKDGTTAVVLISRSPDEILDLPEVKIPETSRSSLQKEIDRNQEILQDGEENLKRLCAYKKKMEEYRNDMEKKEEFAKVRSGASREESFSYIQGFCPVDAVPKLIRAAEKQKWAYIFEEPDNPEEVPVFLRNPRWIEIINPLMKFIGTIPGYKEYDISFWFLVFFSVFFALLIGDAGYGVIFLLGTLLGRKKLKHVPAQAFLLMGVLSVVTIIWGAVTGTWFGCEKIAQLPFLNSLIIPRVNSFIEGNDVFVMYLCFLIGCIQLTIAHGIAAFRRINSLSALEQAGWIAILWSIFFIIGEFVLNKPLPQFFPVLIISGISLAVLFSNAHRNKFLSIIIALINLPLKMMNSFADSLSYLRLFVIGYVSVMVAVSFNDMALQLGFNNIVKGLGAALILFFGHTLNITLGLLSVLVHGVRLNMLEFSGHLDMQWSGVKYKPFKE